MKSLLAKRKQIQTDKHPNPENSIKTRIGVYSSSNPGSLLPYTINNQQLQEENRSGDFTAQQDNPFNGDFSYIPCWATPLQRKPLLPFAEDSFEHEADHIAEKVLQMADVEPVNAAPATIQQQCQDCEDEKSKRIQTKPLSLNQSGAMPDSGTATGAVKQGGMPMSKEQRSYFEPRFGVDFSSVRLHADGKAADAARFVQARAYTVGRDIVFGAGEYKPTTTQGKRLLAHELAHVVQQTAPSLNRGQKEPVHQMRQPETSGFHKTASPVAASALRLSPASVALQRKPSADEIKRAEQDHKTWQQNIYRLLKPKSVWRHALMGVPLPGSLTAEEQAKDPHVLFNNSIEWIHKKRVTFSVLTAVPGQAETADPVTLFDPTVTFPDVGGSVEKTITFEKKVDAMADNKSIQLYAKPSLTVERFRELIRHEVQHVANAHAAAVFTDQEKAEYQGEQPKPTTAFERIQYASQGDMNAAIWMKYKDEFSAHWLEDISRPGKIVGTYEDNTPAFMGGSGGTDKWGSESASGGELKVKGKETSSPSPLYVPEASIQLQNQKQTNIAKFIVNNYFGMQETFLRSPLFRRKIRDLAVPESLNLVNSLRIERIHQLMNGPATRKILWRRTVTREEDIAKAVQSLQDSDIAFLKDRNSSKPFWDEAKVKMSAELFAWMENYIVQGKKDVAPPSAKPSQ